MRKQEEQQTFHFVFTLLSVKMKVRFPCRMVIEQASLPLSKEVSPSQENRFVFNQEIRLKEASEKLFTELNISLITEKGARYTSGIIKLFHNELIRSEGDRLVVTISKCLDSQALCELKVEKVIREGGQRKRILTTIQEKNNKASAARLNQQANSPTVDLKFPRKLQQPMLNIQTKSQTHFPVTSNLRFRKEDDDYRSKQHQFAAVQQTTNKRFGNISPKGRGRATINSKSKHQLMQLNNQLDRDKLIEAEVYRDNYHKLKQKYLRETEHSKNQLNKRILLEQNENYFKLEIVRMKMRNQELEKTLAERNQRMKDMANSLSILQSKESQINIMREDLSNKRNSLNIMEETLITLSKENDQLRSTNKDIAFRLEEKIISLQNQIEILNSQSSSKQQDLERELKMMNETLQFKDNELFRKGQMLEREKRNVYELEKSLQAKMFEYDSLLQSQKGNFRVKMDQLKSKVEQAYQTISKTNSEKADLVSQMDKLKVILLKNEYQFKLYQQQIVNLRSELEELKPIRDKHNDIFKQLRLVTEQKSVLQKNHEKILSLKQIAFEEMAAQFKKECQYIKRNAKDLDERNRTLSSKLIESEGQLDLTKGSLQKLKKNHENLGKQYTEVKQKEKSLKKSLKLKQQQVEDACKQILRLKQKHQSALQTMKVQLSRMREQIGRTNIQLQSQIVKNQQLVETNTQLNMELAKLKMTHQFSEEKYDKLAISSQQKYSQFEKIIKEHEGVIELLEEKIKSQKDNEKDHYGKLQRSDYQISLVVQKNDRIAKELRIFEEKNKQLQFSLRNKQAQLAEALKKIVQIEGKTSQLEQKANQNRQSLQITKNELQKSKKMIELMQRDYDKAKTDLLTYSIQLTEKQRELQQKSQQLRKQREIISSLQSKNITIKKQYQRFKQSVSEAISSSFTQIFNNFSLQKQENSKISTIASIEYPNILNSKRNNSDFCSDLVNAITQAGRENKAQISKLSDRVKQLERDLQLMRNQNDRLHQLSKRQLNEKANYIEQIEEELRNTKNDKGESLVHYQMHVSQLEQHLRQYQIQCQNLMTLKSQQEYSISSFKLDLERLSEEYQKKVHQLKKQREQYQQKLEYQYHNTQLVEKKAYELQVQLSRINSLLIIQKQSSYKKDLKINATEEENQRWVREVEGVKKMLKVLEEKYSELEIQYITVSEMKEKYESMLNEQENKLKDVRVFNNCILKEKEEIIKKELEKNLQITNLQNVISELQHSIHQQQSAKEKIKSDYQQSRQHLKRITLQFKDAEAALNHEKSRYNEIRDKLREKESQLSELKEDYACQKKKYEDQLLKSKNMVQELKEESDSQAKQLQIITNQANENERSLQKQVSKLGQQLQAKREQLGELEELIFVERQNNQSMQESITRLKMEMEDQKKKIDDHQQNYGQLLEQNKQKDESMFQMGGKIYELQSRMREMEEQRLREIQELNNSLNVKYDEDYQEVYQKIEFIQKQKEYFKEKYQEKEEEISKKNEEIKLKEIEEIEIKRGFQDKIKKLEEQKLVIFTEKNKDVSKVLEENKAQFEVLRLKEAQIRKISHELQISRATIQKLQAKIKQLQNDKSGQVKAYQGQIQQLRKKELLFKSLKDEIRSNQWNCEREVRKHIQNFIKRILDIGEKEVRNQSVIGLIKGLEEGILTVLSTLSKD